MKIKKTMMALGASAIFLLPVSAAHAFDTAAGAQTQVELPASAADVSDEKLKEFAEVQQEVESLNAEYQAKIQAAGDAAERNALSAEANKEMMRIVDQSPLTVDEYNRISQLVQQDIHLQDKYRKVLTE